MRQRLLPALCVAVAACSGGTLRDRSGGDLTVRAEPGGSLAGGPARADWCAIDSTLSVIGHDDRWSVAIAARTSWPLARDSLFTVGPQLGGSGSASLAARPLYGDSAGPPIIGQTGTMWLFAGDQARGEIEVEAVRADTLRVRVRGRFRAVPVSDACPRG